MSDSFLPASAGAEARAAGLTAVSSTNLLPGTVIVPGGFFVRKERVPPLRLADDPRQRVRLPNGKHVLMYPGLLRTSSGACSAAPIVTERKAPVPAPVAPVVLPLREYRTCAGRRPLGAVYLRALRYLYTLPDDSSLPQLTELAYLLGVGKSDLDGCWDTLSRCGALTTEHGRQNGKLWWRVVTLAETGRVLRTANAPDEVSPVGHCHAAAECWTSGKSGPLERN